MIQCAVVGIGYWGPNIIRNLIQNQDTQVRYVVDLQPERLSSIVDRYPYITGTSDFDSVLADENVDAVFIVTPVSTHYNLARQSLLAGKHVFVEKPMVMTTDEATELVNLAEERSLLLMVDHTFLFTGAVRAMKHAIESGRIGDVLFYDSTRINLGLFQSDVNVVWDLAPHDLSILDYLIGRLPTTVSATGKAFYGALTNMAYVTLDYGSGMLAHLNLSWMSPVKIRTVLIGGTSKMIMYDDINPDEKVKIYDKGIDVTTSQDPESLRKQLISYRVGNVFSPKIDPTEALALEIQHFVDCVLSNQPCINDGRAGSRVVRILEAAQQSLENSGQNIYL